MSRFSAWPAGLLALVWLAATPPPAIAQPPAASVTADIVGLVGYGRVDGGSGYWQFGEGAWKQAQGFDPGLAVGVRPFRGWARGIGLELQAGWIRENGPDRNVGASPGYSYQTRTRLLAGNAVYHFRPGATTQPFVLIGLGHLRLERTIRCEACLADYDPVTRLQLPRATREWTEDQRVTGMSYGAGVKFILGRRFIVRPQFFAVEGFTGGTSLRRFGGQIGVGVGF